MTDERPAEQHVHKCDNPTSGCHSRGYCRCSCGAKCWEDGNGWTMPAADRPVENSELPGLLDELLKAFAWDSNIEFFPLELPSARAARSKVEELFASLQLEKDFERDCTDLLKAEISRLRTDRLTPEAAREIYDDSNLCARLDDTTVSLLRRISGSGSQ